MEMGIGENTKLANFYLELMDLTDKVNSIEWKLELPAHVKDSWLQGTPLLTELQPETEQELLQEIVFKVFAAYFKWQPGPAKLPAETLKLLKKLTDDELKDLATTAINDIATNKTKWANQLQMSEELMDFLTTNIARLVLNSYAATVTKQLDLEKWKHGYCPICGDSPTMAKLTGKVGFRVLHCGRCETQWRYDRVGCPYCGTKDADKLSFITSEDNKQYRLYLCDQCKSYLKTVDERQCGEVDLFCEDLATADFDKLASSEGYQRGNKRYRA
ncbi:formate dehydrogenase accessory protein FdhE [Peptococcaceae bacterium 1198_IL3148]